MANELLKFKKGKYADLGNVAKDPGTIYVTTDEHAMYVDLDASTRIRLGETIHFATLTEFQDFLKGTKPPYNPQAFYYIDSENALLKWVSSGGTYNPDIDGDGAGDSKGTWKQVNSTSDVEADLSTVKADISILKTGVAGNTTNIGINTTAIEAIKTEIGEASDASGDSLWAAINTNKTNIESNDTDIENLGKNKLDKSEFETFKTTNAAAIKAVDDKVGTKTDAAAADTAFGRIKALEESNATKASQTDVNALKTTIYGGTDLAQDTAADGSLVKKVASLETNSATKAELKITDDKANTNATNITAINNKLGTSASVDNKNTAFQRIEALENAVGGSNGNSLGDRVTAVEKTLNGDTTTGDQGLVKDIEDLEKALGDKANPASGTIYKEIDDIKAKDSQQDTSIASLEKVLNGDASGADQDAKDGVLKRLSDVEDQADKIGTKDSSITETTVWDAIKTNKEAIAANTTAIGTKGEGVTGSTLWEAVKQAQNDASTNATEITNINNEIGNANGTEEGTLWQAIKTNAANIGTLDQTIINKINAANGMTYKGGVDGTTSLLPEANVQIGDTYIATNSFLLNGQQVYLGDLIIAYGKNNENEDNWNPEGDDGYIKQGYLGWTIVNTGYIAAHESTLGVYPTSDIETDEVTGAITSGKGAQINLNSYVSTGNNGDLGQITILSDNLIITSTYNNTNKIGEIKINAVWENF